MKFRKLSEIAKMIAGQSPPSKTYNITGDGFPFFQGKADFQEKYPKVRTWCTSQKRKEALPGDILLSVRAPVGPVNICNQIAIIGRGIAVIRPLKGVSGNYLYYFFKSNEKKVANLGTGSTFKAISQVVLGKIKIPLPRFEDQIRIATLLSRVEALIATRKENLRLLDEFLKSTFLEMFGDPVRNEKGWDIDVIANFSNSRLGKMRDKKFITGNHLRKYIGNSNVQWFRFVFDELLEMDFDEHERKKYKLEAGDLLVCEGGEIGRSAIWKNEFDDCYFQKALHRIRLDYKKAIPEYIQFVFLFYSLFKGFKNVTSKATIAHLTGEKLKNTKVPLPIISLQKQFSQIVKKVEGIKNLYQQSLTDLETLYGALSQKAFKGELDLSRVVLNAESMEEVGFGEDVEIAQVRETPATYDFSALDDIHSLDSVEKLNGVVDQWLEGYLGQLSDTDAFSSTHFMEMVQQRLDELSEESTIDWSVKTYEQVKEKIFQKIKQNQLKQHHNTTQNRINLTKTNGNAHA